MIVKSSEAKGPDVNMAAYLVFDRRIKAFEVASVITADTDLVEPIRLVIQQLGATVGAISPELRRQISPEFVKAASFVMHLQKSALESAQFSPTVTPIKGSRI